MNLPAHTITCQTPSMNLPAHGTASPDPRSHQCVQTRPTNCTKLAWARSFGLSDQACLAQDKLPRLSERATRVTCEVSLRRVSPRLGEITLRLTQKILA